MTEVHDETSRNPTTTRRKPNDGIFSGYENEGIRSIKNGYVNDPGLYGDSSDSTTVSHNQHCQRSVNHHRLVIQEAASNRQMLEIHEGIKPTADIGRTPSSPLATSSRPMSTTGSARWGRTSAATTTFSCRSRGCSPGRRAPARHRRHHVQRQRGRPIRPRAPTARDVTAYLGGIQMAADRMEGTSTSPSNRGVRPGTLGTVNG